MAGRSGGPTGPAWTGALVLGVLGAVARAERLDVPGDFADLQAALDAAQAGDVILVHGGTWGPITVREPVTILGEPRPTIEGEGKGFVYRSPIRLEGSGQGVVVLANVRVDGVANGLVQSSIEPGISGGGFQELALYDSRIDAPRWSLLSGLGVGAPAIGVTVPFVLVERCTVVGGRTDTDTTQLTSGVDGAPAIVAPGVVVVLDSLVRGGAAGVYCHPSTDCGGSCPGGAGGAGVVAAALYRAESTIEGGAGALWKDPLGLPCCQYQDGPATRVGLEVELPGGLAATGSFVIGASFALSWSTPGTSITLLVADGPRQPFALGSGLFFLDEASVASLGDFPSPGVVSIEVPTEVGLIGRSFGFQALDRSAGLTRPLFGVLSAERGAYSLGAR